MIVLHTHHIMRLYSNTSDNADDITVNMKDITSPLPLRAGITMTTALQVMNYNIKAALTIDHPVSIVTCHCLLLLLLMFVIRMSSKPSGHFVMSTKSTSPVKCWLQCRN